MVGRENASVSGPANVMTTKKPAKKAAVKKTATTEKRKADVTTLARKLAHAKGRAPREAEGRPTKWKPENAELAFKYCLLGATDQRLAELFEVAEATVSVWKHAYPEFLEAIMSGRHKADAEIANALYHRAKGYSHQEDDIRTVSIGNGRSNIVITPTIKHYPPDTSAASLWLRNRAPDRWRDKVDVEHSGRLTLDQMPDAEIDARLDEVMKRRAAA